MNSDVKQVWKRLYLFISILLSFPALNSLSFASEPDLDNVVSCGKEEINIAGSLSSSSFR